MHKTLEKLLDLHRVVILGGQLNEKDDEHYMELIGDISLLLENAEKGNV